MMRVIAGQARGHYLRNPRGLATRPTAARVRESIFSRLMSRIDLTGRSVLDLFAGSGALGIEALSRGARHATFVDVSGAAARTIERNLDAVGFSERARVMCLDVVNAIARLAKRSQRFDVVFMDAPYGKRLTDRALRHLVSSGILAPEAWVVVELSVKEDAPTIENIGIASESTIGGHRIVIYYFDPTETVYSLSGAVNHAGQRTSG
jgi:16S rRNA (guanine966-N2)-methyltransferase